MRAGLALFVLGGAAGYGVAQGLQHIGGEEEHPTEAHADAPTRRLNDRATGAHSPMPSTRPRPSSAACPDHEHACDRRMLAEGCLPPVSFPDDAGSYGAADVVRLVEDLAGECPVLSEHIRQLDCGEFPCLVVIERPSGATFEWPANTCRRVAPWQRGERVFDLGDTVQFLPARPLVLDGVETDVYMVHPGSPEPAHFERAMARVRTLAEGSDAYR